MGLSISGEIDLHSAEKLKAELALIARESVDYWLDLEEVKFIDSTGLSVLLDAVKNVRARGGSIQLLHPSPQLMRVLTVSGFLGFFDLDAASVPVEEEGTSAPASEDDGILMETFEAEAKAENMQSLRKSAVRFAETMPFTRQDLDDIKLAVGEATCNALRYGCKSKQESIRITCRRQGRRVSITVSDQGVGFDPSMVPTVQEGNLTEGGRGIFFMRCLMDEVNFQFNGGTSVELVKYLPESGRQTS